jgi:RNA polymerase sigma factor (sigma-70 family)
LRRVSETEKTRQISREAMVAVLRAFLESGDRESADTVFLSLIERLSGAVSNKLVRWSGLTGGVRDDVREAVVLGLYDYLYSLDSGEELWECNFMTCFDMRMLNILGKFTRNTPKTLSSSQVTDDEVTAEAFELADPDSETGFVEIEVREALTYLDRLDSRYGKAFYLKYFAELPEREIAEMMEVSERSVRNFIVASRKHLQSYFRE